jgi:Kef-type K+ transport system membrane component KefB
MDELTGLETLFVVAAVSAVAPIIAVLLPGQRIPQLILLIVGGVLIGPEVLGLEVTREIELISDVGLGLVFLLAGFEIDPEMLFDRPGRLAVIAWVSAAVAAGAVVGGLTAVGYVNAYVAVALALTTTALGTVLPILREKGMVEGPLPRYFLAAGAIGELFPILAIAIFLSVNSRFSALVSLVAISLVAAVLAVFPRFVHGGRLAQIAREGADETSQTTLRLTILLLLGLLVLAGEFGLDVVLGAFLAGAVLRRWAPGDFHQLEAKLDAVGYGFFIPVFFVTAGMGIDLESIRESPDRLLVFFVLLLVVRGLPFLVVYRRALPARQRVQLMLLSATTLPLVVALTQIGLSTGTMKPENAAALVGAGVLSVLFFPLIATAIDLPMPTPAEPPPPPAPRQPDAQQPSPAEGDT